MAWMISKVITRHLSQKMGCTNPRKGRTPGSSSLLKLVNYENQTKLGARLGSSTIMPMGRERVGFTEPKTVLKEKWQEYFLLSEV